ncbi:EamA family transporter [Micromonospora sp. NBC_01392]|uniref:EamA family transporter n=1 Tax=Micromonospora sp. NBC_01392 TaxID=2903588 RepID=UPI00324AD1B7
MVTGAVVLALVSAVSWGVSDFLGGVRSRRLGLAPVLLISQTAALILLTANLAVLGTGPPGPAHLMAAAGAGLSELVGVAALYRGLAHCRASVVAPVAAAAPVVPIGVGVALGEVPNLLQFAGLGFLVAGIVLAAHQRGSTGGGTAAAVAHGAVAAAGFGAFFVFMDFAGAGGIPWALVVSRLTAVIGILGFVLAVRAQLNVPWRVVPSLLLIGVLIIGADAAYTAAAQLGYLSIVAVLSAFHPVVTIVLVAAVLRERIDPVQRIGIAAALAGVLIVTV